VIVQGARVTYRGASHRDRVAPCAVAPVDARAAFTEGTTVGPFHVLETPGHPPGQVLPWEERGLLIIAEAAAHITSVGPHPRAA
jgi:hypothetical protein